MWVPDIGGKNRVEANVFFWITSLSSSKLPSHLVSKFDLYVWVAFWYVVLYYINPIVYMHDLLLTCSIL